MVCQGTILVQGYGDLGEVVVVDNWMLVNEVRYWECTMSCLLGKVVCLGAEAMVGARVNRCEMYRAEDVVCGMSWQM